MGDKSSSQMEGDNTCAACGRAAILIKLKSRALCLQCLHDKEPDIYLRLHNWVHATTPLHSRMLSNDDRIHDNVWSKRDGSKRPVYGAGQYGADGKPLNRQSPGN